MYDPLFLGIGVLFVSIVLARIISESAFRKLPLDDRVRIGESLAPIRRWGLVIMLIAFVAAYNQPKLFFGALVIYVFVTYGYSLIKLHRMKAPSRFIRTYYASVVISLGGFAGYLALTMI